MTIFVVFCSTEKLNLTAIIVAAVAVLALVIAGIGFFIYKKKSGERQIIVFFQHFDFKLCEDVFIAKMKHFPAQRNLLQPTVNTSRVIATVSLQYDYITVLKKKYM